MKKKLIGLLTLLCSLTAAFGFAACAQKGDKGDKGDSGAQGLRGEQGLQGEDGKSAYELYKERYEYAGTEEEWLLDLVNGKLATQNRTLTFTIDGETLVEHNMENTVIPLPDIPEKVGYTGKWESYTSIEGNIVVEGKYTPDVKYTLRDTTYEVTGVNSDKPYLTVLAQYEGKPVTAIGAWAFAGVEGLVSVELPDGILEVKNSAFANCLDLRRISIPASVKSIGEFAFYGCHALVSAYLPDGVERIGKAAFYDCASLESVNIPNALTTLSDSLFMGCRELKTVALGENVEVIERQAFAYCRSLDGFSVGSKVTTIQDRAFHGCYELYFINLPASVTFIGFGAFGDCLDLGRVQFTEANGWTATNAFVDTEPPVPLNAADLRDYKTAAAYLTDTYRQYNWSRT